MYHLRRITILSVCLSLLSFTTWILPRVLNPTPPSPEEKKRDQDWVDSSPYWLDRLSCRWLSLCGIHHLRWDAPAILASDPSRPGNDTQNTIGDLRRRSFGPSEEAHPFAWRDSLGEESWEIADVKSSAGRAESIYVQDTKRQIETTETTETTEKSSPGDKKERRQVPDYVLKYAPLVHLFSGENFWPSDIAEHVKHMTAYTNGSAISGPDAMTLDNLEYLNNYTTQVFLTSNDDVESRPEWLHSHNGIPLPFNNTGDSSEGGGEEDDGEEVADESNTKGHHHHFKDDTTWFYVDRDHPLRRISDPRKLFDLNARGRGTGSQEMRQRGRRVQAWKSSYAKAQAVAANALAESQRLDRFRGHRPNDDGYSKAPAILVMVDKGSGILDAFWFYFYSYNLGQTVLKVRYGNHVGDWEHSMVRFENGVPRALFLSEHAGGQAYDWSALEKFQPKSTSPDDAAPPERPVIYSAVGSHAMYAFPGSHPYVLPFKMLRDETDKGPLWDPAKNNLAYFFDYVVDREEGGVSGEPDDMVAEASEAPEAPEVSEASKAPETPESPVGASAGLIPRTSLTPAASNPDAPVSWFHFGGPWGDETYELGDKRQWRLFGQYHYITGPLGPKFKFLDREKVCQTPHCRILYSIDAGKKAAWYS